MGAYFILNSEHGRESGELQDSSEVARMITRSNKIILKYNSKGSVSEERSQRVKLKIYYFSSCLTALEGHQLD